MRDSEDDPARAGATRVAKAMRQPINGQWRHDDLSSQLTLLAAGLDPWLQKPIYFVDTQMVTSVSARSDGGHGPHGLLAQPCHKIRYRKNPRQAGVLATLD